MESATLTRLRSGPTLLARLRALRLASWASIGFGLLCVAALIGYFAFPTYPTYDTFYALLWGRNLVHLHLPDFQVYRAPTEHPLAIAFGMISALFGQGGARLMVLGSIASFVAAVAGVYRLGRLCFGPLVGVLAAALLIDRFFVENLAAQGYLDVTYLALIVWAVALEVERSRRGVPVFLLLAAAGLLRPDAWALSGLYWLWCAWPRRVASPSSERPRGLQPTSERPPIDNRKRLEYLGLAVLAPVVWVAVDTLVTGSPLYSLHSTAGLAEELERTQGLHAVLGSLWTFTVRIDHLPVVLGSLAGLAAAIWLAPRRTIVPLAALLALLAVFVAEGAGGASVIDRYMMGAAVLLLLFCAVALGGWTMLVPGSALRRAWMVGAAALLIYGVADVARTFSLTSLRTTLAYHEDFHKGLASALNSPLVKAELRRCPLLSLPDNKLIPDARWILGSFGQRDIVARSQARADAAEGVGTLEDRIRRGSVAVYPLGSAVFFEAIVDVGDDPRDQIPLPGFKRIYTSGYYAVYGNC